MHADSNQNLNKKVNSYWFTVKAYVFTLSSVWFSKFLCKSVAYSNSDVFIIYFEALRQS